MSKSGAKTALQLDGKLYGSRPISVDIEVGQAKEGFKFRGEDNNRKYLKVQ